jgi:hypothetical protein
MVSLGETPRRKRKIMLKIEIIPWGDYGAIPH